MGGGLNKPCILCGGNDFQPVFTDTGIVRAKDTQTLAGSLSVAQTARLRVYTCRECGLSFSDVTAQPMEKQPVTLPPDEPFFGPAGSDMADFELPGIPGHSEIGHQEIEEIGNFTEPPGWFLNIGNDQSDILETAKLRGWQSAAVRGLRDELDLTGGNRESDREITKYDVIRLENSLETSADPIDFLKRIGKFLRKNGLLVASMPDYRGWDFPLYGQGMSLLPADLPRWLFNPETLKRLLKLAGYKVLKVTAFQPEYRRQNDVAVLTVDNGSASDRAENTDLPGSLVYPTPHFRIFARQDHKGIFSSLWMEEKEAVSARTPELAEEFL